MKNALPSKPSSLNEPSSSPLITSSFCSSDNAAKTRAAEVLPARRVESGERLAILLRGGQRRLRALLFGALLERPHHVEGFVAAVGTGKLPVDEDGAAAILAARRLRIGRDETID